MKVVCDNCRAVYKIPNAKLKKPVNKATCRNCSHKMLIPRPRADADDNERTLVTAVPPTPPPARPRSEGPATTPIHDEPEATVPGRAPTGFPGTPMPARSRQKTGSSGRRSRSTAPAPAPVEQTDTSMTVPLKRPTDRRHTPAPSPRRPAPEPRPEQRRRTPAPVSRRPDPEPPRAAPAPRRNTPAPSARRPERAPESRRRQPEPEPPRGRSQGQSQGLRTRQPDRQPERRPPPPTPPPRRPDPPPRPTPHQVETRPAHPSPIAQRPPEQTQPTPPPPAAPIAPPAAAYAPAPVAPVAAPAAPIYQFDPSIDLSWAVVGTFVALFGAFVLASLSIVSDPMWRVGLSGFGLMLAIAGSMSTLLILLTGGRGTRRARTFLSILVSGGFSVVLSGVAVSGSLAAMTLMREAESISFEGAPPPGTPIPQPGQVAVAAPAPGAAAAGTAGTAGNDGSADAATPRPRPRPSPRPRPGSQPAPSAPVPAPAAAPLAPDPTREPSAPPEPPPAPAGVPMDVVEVMLYNNLGVKKCFVPLFKSGNVPPRVDIRFTIEPTGAVSAANVQQAALQGGDFENCMRTAVLGVSFPPFQGASQTLTFPFVLNR